MAQEITICGLPFSVNIIENLHDIDHDGDATPLFGQISYKEASINIYGELTEEAQDEVLFHEVLHGVCEATSIKLDEDSVNTLSRALFDTLSRNGWLNRMIG